MENNYDKILNFFTGNSENNDSFSAPRPQGEYIYATTGRAVVRIPKHLCTGDYEPHAKQPNFEVLFHSEQMDKTIYFEELKKIVAENQKKPHSEPCKDCSGRGVKKCDCCGYTNECKKCGGSGKKYINTFEYMQNIPLSITHLEILMNTMHFLGINEMPYCFKERLIICQVSDSEGIQIKILAEYIEE